MTTVITGRLGKDASEFQAGESIGFGIRLGVKYKDRKDGQDKWTNYQAAIFAKSDSQIDFYRSVLLEGCIVSVSAEKEAIGIFNGENGVSYYIDMLNASLVYANNPNNNQAPQQTQNQANRQPQQSNYGNQPAPSQQQRQPQQQQYAHPLTPQDRSAQQPQRPNQQNYSNQAPNRSAPAPQGDSFDDD